MVKQINLTEIGNFKANLLAIVSKKIADNKITPVNENLNKDLKVDWDTISEILNSIEYKFRECEILFYTYLESVDHSVLSGNVASLPFTLNVEFSYATNIMRKTIEINDKSFYKEIVDINFRHFILLIASIYENIVALSEILLKKIIIHTLTKKPISTPLHDFVLFLEALMDLGYRKNDNLYKCISSHSQYFDKYLKTLNLLRNKFIHGFSSVLASDGATYRIIRVLEPLTPNAPELDINLFSKIVMDETGKFIFEIITALTQSIKHHSKSIPA